jgi:hypothetical protein
MLSCLANRKNLSRTMRGKGLEGLAASLQQADQMRRFNGLIEDLE